MSSRIADLNELSARIKEIKPGLRRTWRQLAEDMGIGEQKLQNLCHGNGASADTEAKIRAWLDKQG